MVADALTVGGWRVLHIGSDAVLEPHELTPFLSVHSGRLTYPPPLWGGLGYHAP
jgi:hypothetical protein